MTDPTADPATTDTLLDSVAGSNTASNALFEQVYAELRALAASYMRNEPAGLTLDATALVHEAYLRMVDQTRTDWRGRSHFFAIAARAIRRVLVDHARQRNALKRGGGAIPHTLLDAPEVGEAEALDLLALDDALARLEALHARHASVVQLRYFAGLSIEECATALGVARSTVAGDWAAARAWLASEMGVHEA